MYANVIVNINSKSINRQFDYEIPNELSKIVKPGMRVVVDFNHRPIVGFVIGLSQTSSFSTKPILYTLDKAPILTKELLGLIDMLQSTSRATFQACFDLVVPKGLQTKTNQQLILVDQTIKDDSVKALFSAGAVRFEQIDKTLLKKINKLIATDKIDIKTTFTNRSKVKYDQYVSRKNEIQMTNKQQEIIDYLNEPKTMTSLKEAGFSTNIIKRLIEKDGLTVENKVTYRKIEQQYNVINEILNLTTEQKYAVDTVLKNFNQYKRFLLKGITGSGKTEVYLKLIEEAIKENKQALVLVPEISLVPQMVARLKSRFNQEIAVIHSGLSMNERYDQWRLINDYKALIAVGTRSAVFMPFKKLGIIIMDEEQEQAYIQKDNPSYDTKQMVIFRAKYHKIPIVYGSASPSIQTYHDSVYEKTTRLELTKRPVGHLPSISIVDMKEELKNGNLSIFSSELTQMIEDRLKKKEQSMILMNRRGYANFVMCRDCSYVFNCPTCQISLSYHKKSNLLKCHHCGYEQPFLNMCTVCHSTKIRTVGIG
ncbi:MAG TPA: primosomal protein N', partial [Acholeplasma sp.]|nr:primosomal protein N' [Acholeplasma sp.]